MGENVSQGELNVRGSSNDLARINASLQISKSEERRKSWLFWFALTLVTILVCLFAFGFCSYINAMKPQEAKSISPPAVQEVQKQEAAPTPVVKQEPQVVVPLKQSSDSQQSTLPDWHFLLILAELLISMVLIFFITMKAIFPKNREEQALIPEEVTESVKNLTENVKSLIDSIKGIVSKD
ncbi:MAG: hypothetical protein ACRCV6_05060 [Formosimonas sp.]